MEIVFPDIVRDNLDFCSFRQPITFVRNKSLDGVWEQTRKWVVSGGGKGLKEECHTFRGPGLEGGHGLENAVGSKLIHNSFI